MLFEPSSFKEVYGMKEWRDAIIEDVFERLKICPTYIPMVSRGITFEYIINGENIFMDFNLHFMNKPVLMHVNMRQ